MRYEVDCEDGKKAVLVVSRFLGSYEIESIDVPYAHRGKGHGRSLLRDCIRDADADQVTLTLLVASGGGLDNGELHKWYRRHGFVPTMPEVDSIPMRRLPRVVRVEDLIGESA